MHNINTNSTQNNNNNETEEYQPAKTSLQSRNEKSQTFHKKFFMIKNEARSHRTSYTTSDSIYIGNYVNKKRNGHGKLILADQSYYEGNFKDGLFDGNGYYKTKTYIYKGEFLSNKKNGKGKLEYLNKKSVYEGEFKNDMKNGYGEEKYNDGSMYKGYFVNNMKEGKGILTLKKEKNNSVYEGEFKKDKICGRGIYKWDEKKIYNGENNDLITNIKYQEKNKLLCMYTNKITEIKNDKTVETLKDYENKKIVFATIELTNASMTVEEKSSGIFTADSVVNIINSDNKIDTTYTTESVTKEIYTHDNIIALNLGSEIEFINTSGWLVKKYIAEQEITSVVISNSVAGIIYRDKIEIINL